MPSNTFATSGRDLVGHTIDGGRLEFLSVLGVGAYGVVYLAVDLHAPQPVYLAVKCLLRAGLDSRQRHFQRREIALHQLASRHPNVVTLHKVIEEEEYIYVVMDFCDDGDLFGMITERQRYIGHDLLIKKVFLQIVDAVEYCHSMGIFHRDLKPENILCTRDGERICIADFGLATSERQSTDFGCGSTFYLSPECQGGLFERLESYSTRSNDIWSLGVILVNLTCGRNPWRQACPNDETFRAYVHNPEFLRTILPISHQTNHILKGLFALDPRDRLSLRDLRSLVSQVSTFTMTDDELRTAHSAARAAAAAVGVRPADPAPVPAPAPVHHVAVQPVPVPVPVQVQVPIQQKMDMDMDVDMHTVQDAGIEHDYSTYSWGQYDVDPSFIDAIDFTHAPQHQQQQQQQQRVHDRERERQQQARDDQSTPSLVPNDHRYPLATTSSRTSCSSSSGEASLPPTPEFNPADKGQGTAGLPRWDLGKGKAVASSNLHSPTQAQFAL